MTIRVLLADDQVMVRDGLSAVLGSAPDIEVVGEAGTGRQAVDRARELAPDVVVMDIRMPEMDGLEATRLVVAGGTARADGAARDSTGHDGAGHDGTGHDGGAEPRTPRVLVLTTFDLDEYVYDALGAGASGFLLKDAPAADLVHAVRVVASGEALLAPSVTRRLIADVARRRRTRRTPDRASASTLTTREVEVLGAVARGLSNAEIATELVLAEQTVKTHVGRILMKLALRDRTQAVVFAYENGLVPQS